MLIFRRNDRIKRCWDLYHLWSREQNPHLILYIKLLYYLTPSLCTFCKGHTIHTPLDAAENQIGSRRNGVTSDSGMLWMHNKYISNKISPSFIWCHHHLAVHTVKKILNYFQMNLIQDQHHKTRSSEIWSKIRTNFHQYLTRHRVSEHQDPRPSQRVAFIQCNWIGNVRPGVLFMMF